MSLGPAVQYGPVSCFSMTLKTCLSHAVGVPGFPWGLSVSDYFLPPQNRNRIESLIK